MIRRIAFLALTGLLVLSSCAKQESQESPEAPKPAAETPPPAAPSAGGPHAVVNLKDGSQVPGTIVASTQTDMVVAGDDGNERTIPMDQVKSVVYGEAKPQPQARPASSEPSPRPQPARPPVRPEQARAPASPTAAAPAPAPAALPPAPAPRPAPVVTTKTYELPVDSEVSVRTNEEIDSGTAAEGQTFSVQVTRDARDEAGDVVIPRGSEGHIVILSASRRLRISPWRFRRMSLVSLAAWILLVMLLSLFWNLSCSSRIFSAGTACCSGVTIAAIRKTDLAFVID